MSASGKTPFQQDVDPEQIRLANERAKLRRALRLEFLKKQTNPHNTEPHIFDPQMQRYYSMHMTITERFVPTFKNFCHWLGFVFIPIVGYGLFLKSKRESLDRKCRSGELKYEDRRFKFT